MILCSVCNCYKGITEYAKSHLNVAKTKGLCRSCNSKRVKEHYKANPKAYNERSAVYVNNNRSTIIKYKQEYALKNSYRLTKKTAIWRKNNPEKYRILSQNISARRRACFNRDYIKNLSEEDMVNINNYYEAAIICEKYYGNKHSVDHIVPIKHSLVCGLHVPWNLQVLTLSDNSKKSNKFTPHIIQHDI